MKIGKVMGSLIVGTLLIFTQVALGASNIFTGMTVNDTNGSIILNTNGNIDLNDIIKSNNNNMSNYINLTTAPSTYSPVSDAVYGYVSDSLSNFNVSTNGNSLVLTAKNNKFSYFANYTLKIYDELIYLLGSTPRNYNRSTDNRGFEYYTFTSNNIDIVENIYPSNGATSVDTNPLINMRFKFPISQSIDRSKISLSYLNTATNTYVPATYNVNGVNYPIDIQNYIFISPDGKLMRVDMDGLMNSRKFSLSPNTTYSFKILSGALSYMNFRDLYNNYKYNKDIILNFTTGSTTTNTIYKVEALAKTDFVVTDLYNRDTDFTISGYGLGEVVASNKTIRNIRLVRASDSKTITIMLYDIISKDNSRIVFKLRGTNALELAKEISVGTYQVFVDYNDSTSITSNLSKINILSKGKPTVIRTEPSSGAVIEENNMYYETINNAKVQYIKAAFADIDNKLELISGINSGTVAANVYIDGSAENIYNAQVGVKLLKGSGEATLYIPLKYNLSINTPYNVVLSPNIIQNDVLRNDEYRWSFRTNSYPVVTGASSLTVPYGYTRGEKILLDGDMFNSSTTVYFKNLSGTEFMAATTRLISSKQLEVTLPYNSSGLEVGSYEVIVKNSAAYRSTINGSYLNVVPSGKIDIGYYYKNTGDAVNSKVKENLKISENTLIIDSFNSYLILDLDRLLGEDTYMRKILFKSGSYFSAVVNTKSKYADVIVNGISTQYNSADELSLNIGRVDNDMVDNIKKKLKYKQLVSDAIGVYGDNLKMSSINITLPYDSIDTMIRPMRYDLDLKSWLEVGYTIDKINKVVKITSPYQGIFAVVR